ncbi:Karyopherin transporter [Cladochytrium tenue]|nr:Karyopherin transporter [Cladochytrium tenue]
MDAILDFSVDLDISLLDRVVQSFFSAKGPEQEMVNRVLTQFQEHPDAWKRVDMILERSQLEETKFIALSVLDNLIKTMWMALPDGQRQGIKNFIVAVIIKSSSDKSRMDAKRRTYLTKLNTVLVQILKQEWPKNWPTFIPEIVASSKTNLGLCENNMAILKLLSEEIFDFSTEQLTQAKAKNLKNSMRGEFSEIFQLCQEVLDKATRPSLILATLETLLRFLNWIPLGYIFETNLIELLITRFFEVPKFRNVTLECLTEIGALQVGTEYDQKFVVLFNATITAINKIMPMQSDIPSLYESDGDAETFIQNLAMFLTGFLGAHVKVSDLYEELQLNPNMDTPLLNLGMGTPAMSNYPLRKNTYSEVLSNLRVVMIECMVKPEEVLIVENDEGEIVRETLKESDTIVLYKSMREVLIYLTHLDVDDTETIMTDKLARQMDGSEWSWENLSKLAWAIGSISGAMSEETEKRFLVQFIKYLLGLVEMKRGKDNKAVVASNIMYIVGHYPRFLRAHWKFLKTVVNKLFEFMHELHDGVQDMACDTFIKIALKCKRQLVHVFYEAVGHMISAQPSIPTQERLIIKLMELPNQAWADSMREAAVNSNFFKMPDNVKILGNTIKTNVAACSSIGSLFVVQISKIYWDLLEVYKVVSGMISDSVVQQGLIATSTPRVRGMRTIKKEILKLIEIFVSKADDLNQINQTMIPPLLEVVLGDYARNVKEARDAEVLNLMAGVVSRLGDVITERVPAVLDAVFECTLNMINQDFENFPEHRLGFFRLIHAINSCCFPGTVPYTIALSSVQTERCLLALLNIPVEQFKLFLDFIVWGFKHTMSDISDLGLTICLELTTNFSKSDPAIMNAFCQTYYLSILQDIFFVLTNSFHKSGFKLQSLILAQLFQLVESGQITAPLFNPTQVGKPNMSNQEFLREHVMAMNQLISIVGGMFEHCKDLHSFKAHLRDFLITLKEFAGEDNSELFLEEREAEVRVKKEQLDQIPGMVKPHERANDRMMD